MVKTNEAAQGQSGMQQAGLYVRRAGERAAEAVGNGIDALTGAAAEDSPKATAFQTKAGYVSIAATVVAVAAVAGGVIALVTGILSGAVLAGALGFTACVLIAITANDVRVIATKISNGGFRQCGRLFTCDNPIESISVQAAKKGTVILRPDLVRWAFSLVRHGHEE